MAVTVTGNEVRDYQKAGIVANGSVAATVTATPCRASARWATSRRTACSSASAPPASSTATPSGTTSTPAPTAACGLLLFEADGVKQKRNMFSGNEQDVCNFGRGGGSVPTS